MAMDLRSRRKLLDRYRVERGEGFRLDDIDPADTGGFTFWRDQLRAAQCQGASAVVAKVNELSIAFIGSAQYQGRDAARPPAERNKRYVSDLFNAFLRRGADLGGYSFWVGQIDSGAQSRDQVRQQYVNSPEFQVRVNAVAGASCIP